MELPSETTKNSFAQLVAVAGGLCAVVVGTIALDAEEIAPRGSGVDHGKSRFGTRNNLPACERPNPSELVGHTRLPRTAESNSASCRYSGSYRLRALGPLRAVIKERLQISNTPGAGTGQVDHDRKSV